MPFCSSVLLWLWQGWSGGGGPGQGGRGVGGPLPPDGAERDRLVPGVPGHPRVSRAPPWYGYPPSLGGPDPLVEDERGGLAQPAPWAEEYLTGGPESYSPGHPPTCPGVPELGEAPLLEAPLLDAPLLEAPLLEAGQFQQFVESVGAVEGAAVEQQGKIHCELHMVHV